VKTKKTKRAPRKTGRALAVRKPNQMVELAQHMATMVQSLDSRITSMGEAIGRFDQYREQINQRLLEIVDGKQLVLDPVLSQRLQTMANTLSAPTYVIEGKGSDGKYRTLNILSVGAFAGTVKIQVQVPETGLAGRPTPDFRPLDPVQATGAGQPAPLKKGDDIDPLLQR
jgi:hypothetical protein